MIVLTALQHATHASKVSALPQRAPEQDLHQRCAILGNPRAILAALLHALRLLRWTEIGC